MASFLTKKVEPVEEEDEIEEPDEAKGEPAEDNEITLPEGASDVSEDSQTDSDSDDEVEFVIKKKKVRCAGRRIGLGHRLGFIVKSGKVEFERLGHFF